MVGAVFRSIISGERYPAALLNGVVMRIRAEQDNKDKHTYKITRGRAAIIKAYLLRNADNKDYDEEEIRMSLNEEWNNVAYVLGREFAILEAIQEDANPGINATIKDRYFNSACAMPASIFPVLLKLKNSHIRKFEMGKKIYYEKMITELESKIGGNEKSIPARMTLEQQGIFILGYYHQKQKRYEKKEEK